MDAERIQDRLAELESLEGREADQQRLEPMPAERVVGLAGERRHVGHDRGQV